MLAQQILRPSARCLHFHSHVRHYGHPYAHPLFSHKFRCGQGRNFGITAKRSFHHDIEGSMSPDEGSTPNDDDPSEDVNSDDGSTESEPTTPSSNKNFHALDKDVAILKMQVSDVKGIIKDLDRKIDDVKKTINHRFYAIMGMIVGSMFVKGGYDFWRDESRVSNH